MAEDVKRVRYAMAEGVRLVRHLSGADAVFPGIVCGEAGCGGRSGADPGVSVWAVRGTGRSGAGALGGVRKGCLGIVNAIGSLPRV